MSARKYTPPRKKGLTKADLATRVYELHGGLTRSEASAVVDSILGAVKTSLVDGRPVKIQNFGVFEVTRRQARTGVNPASGKKISIPPHKGLSFRPAPRLKSLVDPGDRRAVPRRYPDSEE